MNCDELNSQLESYLDGELTLSDRRDVDAHLVECKSCTNKIEALRALQQQVRGANYQKVPAGLKNNIQNKLRDITGEQSNQSNLLAWLGLGGGALATGSFATWVLMTFVFLSPLHTQLADAVIASHISSLMVDHATDVKSSDRHTVKPWFNGRLDFSPPVKDLSADGFKLIGGRLDYLQGQIVAAMVYQRRAHIVNAFIFKNKDANLTTEPENMQRHGFNLVYWKQAGLDFWLISDLNPKELNQLAQLTTH